MDQVRAFLSAQGLDPTPDHYQLVYRAIIAEEPVAQHAVQTAMTAEGRLSTETAAKLVAGTRQELPLALIEDLVTASRQNLDRLAAILDQSRDDAQAYGNALEHQVETLNGAGVPQQIFAQFLDLTRSLIGRTRDAENRMIEMNGEIETLQVNLDSATRAADSDPLTGLANRRALERRLTRAIIDSRAHHAPVTLAYCDIDHFKDINDGYGHEIGDRILKFVAQLFLREADPDTLISRYGGEEFVILFEHVPFEKAYDVVNELRLDLGAKRLHLKDSGRSIGNITFSAGIAALEDEMDVQDLLREADQALYQAKELGRDRLVTAREAKLNMGKRANRA
jgi:diguanylate cyclase